jgi:hypothetical protein
VSIIFLSFFLSHCVQLLSICMISGICPGIAHILNFSDLGDNAPHARCVQIGKVLILLNRLLLFTLSVQRSTSSDHLFGKREVSTDNRNIGCTISARTAKRALPRPPNLRIRNIIYKGHREVVGSAPATYWLVTAQHLSTHPQSNRYYTLRMAESKPTHERGSVAGAFGCPCAVAPSNGINE